jgi:hypothetical protein
VTEIIARINSEYENMSSYENIGKKSRKRTVLKKLFLKTITYQTTPRILK